MKFNESVDLHGGPPLAYVPAALSPSGQPYYVGVLHSIERFKGGVRVYRHFAFKARKLLSVARHCQRALPLGRVRQLERLTLSDSAMLSPSVGCHACATPHRSCLSAA